MELNEETINAAKMPALREMMKNSGLQIPRAMTSAYAKDALIKESKKRGRGETEGQGLTPVAKKSRGLDEAINSALMSPDVEPSGKEFWDESALWIRDAKLRTDVPKCFRLATETTVGSLSENNVLVVSGVQEDEKRGLALYRVGGISTDSTRLTRLKSELPLLGGSLGEYNLSKTQVVFTLTADNLTSCQRFVAPEFQSLVGFRGRQALGVGNGKRVEVVGDLGVGGSSSSSNSNNGGSSNNSNDKVDGGTAGGSAINPPGTRPVFKFTDVDGKTRLSAGKSGAVMKALELNVAFERSCMEERKGEFMVRNEIEEVDPGKVKQVLLMRAHARLSHDSLTIPVIDVGDPWNTTVKLGIVENLPVFRDDDLFKKLIFSQLFTYSGEDAGGSRGLQAFVGNGKVKVKEDLVEALRNMQHMFSFVYGQQWDEAFRPCVDTIELLDRRTHDPEWVIYEVTTKLLVFSAAMRVAVDATVKKFVPGLDTPARCVLYLQSLLGSIEFTTLRWALFTQRKQAVLSRGSLGGTQQPQPVGQGNRVVTQPRTAVVTPAARQQQHIGGIPLGGGQQGGAAPRQFCLNATASVLKIVGAKGPMKPCSRGAGCQHIHPTSAKVTPSMKEWWKSFRDGCKVRWVIPLLDQAIGN